MDTIRIAQNGGSCVCEVDGITTTDTLGVPLMPVCARVWVLVDRDTRRHDMRVPTGSHFVIELGPWGGVAPWHLVCSWLCWSAGMRVLIRHACERVITVISVILGIRCLGIIGFSNMTLVLTNCHKCHIGGCSWCGWWCGVLMTLDVACRPCRASMFFQRVVTVSLPDRGKPLESLQFQGL